MSTRSSELSVVVVPTRNRASLASEAIRSALGLSSESVNILVSDNSTIEEEAGPSEESVGSGSAASSLHPPLRSST